MTFSLLLQRYGSAAEALRAVPDLARRGGRLLKPASRAVAEAELTANERAGARLLFKGGQDYPARLAKFDDAPPVLSARDQSTFLADPALPLSVRATPRSTRSGLHRRWLRTSAPRDMSSFRDWHGIDAAAHNGALSSGTIAVIAGGIDVVYPSENTDLQESIAEAGLVLAEMPPEHSRRHGIFRSETASSAALPLVPSLLRRRNGQARSSPHGKQRNAAAKSWPFQARRSTRAHGGATI